MDREKKASHGHDPGLGLPEEAPVGGQQVAVACRGAGKKGHPHGDDQKEQEKDRHHEFADLLDAGGYPQDEDDRRGGHGDEVQGTEPKETASVPK